MSNLGSNFYPKLVQIASELNMKPEDILAVMASESGIKPESFEHEAHGSGLIGFMPDTLHNLGYKGSWEDFIKTSGEEQLDYVKKYIQSKIQQNGGPFKSAAQYYVANFFPVALKLPGIKAQEPNTAFVEKYPETVTGKDGKKYSKKYYDIGYHIDPHYESVVYTKNHLFHGNTPNAITYGDMIRQVEINKKNPIYRQAINAMKNATGYQPNSKEEIHSRPTDFISRIKDMLNKFIFSTQIKNDFLISVGSSSDYATTMEYARILSMAMEEYLNADTKIHTDSNSIEIECKVAGDKKILHDALKELSVGVSDAFKYATQDLGSITTFSLITADNKSDYDILHPRTADLQYRKFKLKFARKHG